MQTTAPVRFFSVASTMLILTLVLTAVVGKPALAQDKAAAKPAVPDSAKALVGTWEGSYNSDHAPSGAIKLVFTQDSVVKLSSLALAMGNEMQSVPVRNFSFSTTDISWTQDMMGMSCEATAVLKNGQMKGAIVCGHGSVTFTASKH